MLDLLQKRLQRTLPMARLEMHELQGCAGLQLALINADFPTGPLPPDVMQAVIQDPAYWAFCWGSGLALARWLLAHPATVKDQVVVDFGAGSGVAALAAAKAGAARVLAVDLDPDALLASHVNAQLNGMTVETLVSLDEISAEVDLILLADVLYDRSNLPLLGTLEERASTLLVADSRVRDLGRPGYRLLETTEALTFPNLGEFDTYREVRLFCYGAAPSAAGAGVAAPG